MTTCLNETRLLLDSSYSASSTLAALVAAETLFISTSTTSTTNDFVFPVVEGPEPEPPTPKEVDDAVSRLKNILKGLGDHGSPA